MEYHDVLPNISLSRISVYARNLDWKKSTLEKKHENINNSQLTRTSIKLINIRKNINNSSLDGMSLASFCQSRAE